MEAQLIAPDQLTHVPEHIRLVLAQVKAELIALYGDKFQKLILFGSYARGDFRDDSDIDLMLIIDDSTPLTDLQSNGLFDLKHSHFEREHIRVEIMLIPLDNYKRAETFLLMFVQKDGIDL